MLPMGRGDGVNGVWGVRVPMVPRPRSFSIKRTRSGSLERSTRTGRASPMRGAIPTTGTSPSFGELSIRSEDFRVRWASHDVRQYRTGSQPFHHPLVGDLTLSYEALQLTADIGLTLVVYTAEPD